MELIEILMFLHFCLTVLINGVRAGAKTATEAFNIAGWHHIPTAGQANSGVARVGAMVSSTSGVSSSSSGVVATSADVAKNKKVGKTANVKKSVEAKVKVVNPAKSKPPKKSKCENKCGFDRVENQQTCCSKCPKEHADTCGKGFMHRAPSAKLCNYCGKRYVGKVRRTEEKAGVFSCCTLCPSFNQHTSNCVAAPSDEGLERFKEFLRNLEERKGEYKEDEMPFSSVCFYSREQLSAIINDDELFKRLVENFALFGFTHNVKGFKFDKSKPDEATIKGRKDHGGGAIFKKIFHVAMLFMFLTVADCTTVRFFKTSERPLSLGNSSSLSIWKLNLKDAELVVANKNGFIEFDNVLYVIPKAIDVLIPCEYKNESIEFNGSLHALVDKCGGDTVETLYDISFSSAYSCEEEPENLQDFQSMLSDVSVSCALVTDRSLLMKIKRKFRNVKLRRQFTVATSRVATYFEYFLKKDQRHFEAKERSMGIVKVGGEHRGTFFCADDYAYTAWHVVSDTDSFFYGKMSVELCSGSCTRVIDMTRIGEDVARLNVVENWCTNLNSQGLTNKVAAYNRDLTITIMDVVISQRGDSTTATVGSGRWESGMSGGPLIVNGYPVAVVSSMRGWFTQELQLYGLDGKPYKAIQKFEL